MLLTSRFANFSAVTDDSNCVASATVEIFMTRLLFGEYRVPGLVCIYLGA
jgi:hypothetical protein